VANGAANERSRACKRARARQFRCFAVFFHFLPIRPPSLAAPARIYGEIVKRRLKNSWHIPSPGFPRFSYDRRIYILHFRRAGMRAKPVGGEGGGRKRGRGNTLALRAIARFATDHDSERMEAWPLRSSPPSLGVVNAFAACN